MTTKAAHYIEQLDNARCEGNWSAVPELVRKIRKHAPDRECLALTAETECTIVKATVSPTASTADASDSLAVATTLPKLLTVVENDTTHPEDVFQARVCMGWLHWVVAEYDHALNKLPRSLEEEGVDLDPAHTASEWTNVCALKAAYMRANSLRHQQDTLGALSAFQLGSGSLAKIWSGQPVRKQQRYWAELFLTDYCVTTSQAYKTGEVSLEEANALAGFRLWARYWRSTSGSIVGGHGFKGSVSRRRVWNEYYLALSRILSEDLNYPIGSLDKIPDEGAVRSQLRTELKTVEAAYHQLLMGETTFPKASEERQEIEAFVKMVAKNWSILGGRGWRDVDLGPGGRPALSRSVLDILYNAATKTYHSTAILRLLFQLHLSLAEFDYAFKAFDSYMELVKKGKARVDKTGKLEPSLDDDAMVLETMAQCTLALCRYGHRQAAEKARHLGAELEDWLAKLPQFRSDVVPSAISENDIETHAEPHPVVPAHIVAFTWQAIGVCHAHWSRITWEAASRTEIQSKAIRCLRRSLATEFGKARDVRSLYGLALLLAERRELTTAIDVTRTALMSAKDQDETYHLIYGPFWLERSLIPMWHLLALLLSARQDYTAAARACEGALEQFKEPQVLFGKGTSHFRSQHLNDAEAQEQGDEQQQEGGLVDEMDLFEKESILEVKMTQIALLEVMEGPQAAVNASSELLTLFSRLFGNVSTQPMLLPPQIVEPPKTSATFRSIRGSIFGGKARPASRPSSIAPSHESYVTLPIRPGTSQTTASGAPTIQVTEDDGVSRPPISQRNRGPLRKRSLSRKRGSVTKGDEKDSLRRASTGNLSHQATVVDGESFHTPSLEPEQTDFFTFAGSKQSQRLYSASASGRHLPSFHSYRSTNSAASHLSVEATYSSASQLPLVQFTAEKDEAIRTGILIRVWLLIAGLYRKASLVEDSKGAWQEARKLVVALESAAVKDPSASSNSHTLAWAERRNVHELWGDIWCEAGHLALVKKQPYSARADFENALIHCPNHPSATVGLSNILLDVYNEDLVPPPSTTSLEGLSPAYNHQDPHDAQTDHMTRLFAPLPSTPLGLTTSSTKTRSSDQSGSKTGNGTNTDTSSADSDSDADAYTSDDLPVPYKARRLPLTDRLAARDRAYTLLYGLSRLGTGWNYSEAWFVLARAYEASGQPDKAKEVLWWCVELEEAMGVRDWRCLGGGGFVI